MTTIDWILVAVIALTALGGYRRGLVGTVFSLVGLAAGAIVGARLAPHILADGSSSQYTAALGLAGAAVGASIGAVIARAAGSLTRTGLHLLPPLKLLDSAGGLVAGAVWGCVLVWIVGAVALQIPGHHKLKKQVRQSQVLERIDKAAPPDTVLKIKSELATVSQQALHAKSP